MKNTLEGTQSRSDDTEDGISNQENRIVEITQKIRKKEKEKE